MTLNNLTFPVLEIYDIGLPEGRIFQHLGAHQEIKPVIKKLYTDFNQKVPKEELEYLSSFNESEISNADYQLNDDSTGTDIYYLICKYDEDPSFETFNAGVAETMAMDSLYENFSLLERKMLDLGLKLSGNYALEEVTTQAVLLLGGHIAQIQHGYLDDHSFNLIKDNCERVISWCNLNSEDKITSKEAHNIFLALYNDLKLIERPYLN